MAKVALVRCETYDTNLVLNAVKRGLELIGGVEQFTKKDETILLKPNLLVAEHPKRCVTTHPSIFKAVAQLFIEAGARLVYGDSPAVGSPGRAAKKAGLQEVADELGIKLADFKNGRAVILNDALQNRQFTIANGALECDGIISLPKLKTHALERFTGCVKNQFGCVPGVLKGEFHFKIPDAHQFGKMLVDLNSYLNPRLYIMDGIQAMEGNGPRSGKPKQMNIILLSSDPIALDATVCRIVNVNPEIVPTIKFGKEAGSGTYLETDINLVGDDIEQFKVPSFDIKRKPIRAYNPEKGAIARFFNNRLVAKPIILKNKCTQCGTCISICPSEPKALDWHQGDKENPPVYNYDICIRCYCCQEVCPDESIVLKSPVLRRFFKF
ncbi:MAG: DUF362 domain-containing protein [Proteobacteria bacterium]|nr:DUF362 domain-containing protein [Pseudomonadota bacterium]